MPRRTIGFIIFAFLVSLGCLRLGVWQLSRLEERRARNAATAARQTRPESDAFVLTGDPDSLRYRPVRAEGRFDYANQFVLSGRPRNGSPGVYLLTPMRSAAGDAVLVSRGWVYAPDGKSIELSRWNEADSGVVHGFVDSFGNATGPIDVVGAMRTIRVADIDSLAARLPYPVRPFLVVQTSDSVERIDRPARLTPPRLDDGPHESYAIQWFAFALIAWGGIGVVTWKSRQAH